MNPIAGPSGAMLQNYGRLMNPAAITAAAGISRQTLQGHPTTILSHSSQTAQVSTAGLFPLLHACGDHALDTLNPRQALSKRATLLHRMNDRDFLRTVKSLMRKREELSSHDVLMLGAQIFYGMLRARGRFVYDEGGLQCAALYEAAGRIIPHLPKPIRAPLVMPLARLFPVSGNPAVNGLVAAISCLNKQQQKKVASSLFEINQVNTSEGSYEVDVQFEEDEYPDIIKLISRLPEPARQIFGQAFATHFKKIHSGLLMTKVYWYVRHLTAVATLFNKDERDPFINILVQWAADFPDEGFWYSPPEEMLAGVVFRRGLKRLLECKREQDMTGVLFNERRLLHSKKWTRDQIRCLYRRLYVVEGQWWQFIH